MSGYRYTLYRRWEAAKYSLPIVMLNPSTADEQKDDPTIRRCIGFATREGYGGIHVVNLFGARATNPNELRDMMDPEGPDNHLALEGVAEAAAKFGVPILCAWGAHPMVAARQPAVLSILGSFLADLVCLGKTTHGYPKHPLYIEADQPFVPFP